MAQLLTRRPEKPVEVERLCALCRGKFVGPGFASRGAVFCCDVCARRASRPGLAASLLTAASLVALGYILGWRR